jgi:hypothetical protein
MLAATRDGRILLATNRGSDTVSIFELTGADPLAAGAWKVTLPDGRHALVGVTNADDVAEIDLGTMLDDP